MSRGKDYGAKTEEVMGLIIEKPADLYDAFNVRLLVVPGADGSAKFPAQRILIGQREIEWTAEESVSINGAMLVYPSKAYWGYFKNCGPREKMIVPRGKRFILTLTWKGWE